MAAYGPPLELVEVADLFEDAEMRATLAGVNPVAQIPALMLDDGRIMTESAAITLHLADLTGSDLLVPPADAPGRAAFLRWLIFMVAGIYPCFTFADHPRRFVADPDAATAFKLRAGEHGKGLWRMVETEARGPWFPGTAPLGGGCLYRGHEPLAAGHDWFAAEAPKLDAIARAVEARPGMAAVLAANFPG